MGYLNETSVGDLLKIIDAFGQLLKTSPEDGKYGKAIGILKNSTTNSKYKGSISSQANKLVMTFPVLSTNTISYSTASMLSKAIERKCTLMIQQIFAADILVAGENSGGIQHQINNIYTGIDFDTISVDDMINMTNNITAKQGKAFFEHAYLMEVADLSKKAINGPVYESPINENSLATFKIGNDGKAVVDETMILGEDAISEAPYKLPDDIDTYTISNIDSKTVYDMLVKAHGDSQINDKIRDLINNGNIDPESLDDILKLNQNSRENISFKKQIEKDIKSMKLDIERHKLGVAGYDLNRRKLAADIEKNELDKKKFEYEKKRNLAKDELDYKKYLITKRSADQQALQARNDYFKKQLMDTDVKKANELVPSMLIVNYAVKTDGEGDVIQSSAIVGVKTRLIPLDSFEIIDRLTTKNKDKSGFVKFIRATTGEIKFMKDFVLAIDKAKIEALNKSKRGSANPIWKVLERRAAVNNLRKALGQKNDASPITTLVVTQEEVDYLRKTANMDLDNVNTANYIINAFNLLGLCIVDESAEVAKFLFDGEFNQFEAYSFSALQKEAGDSDMYKKVINLMSKRM